MTGSAGAVGSGDAIRSAGAGAIFRAPYGKPTCTLEASHKNVHDKSCQLIEYVG